MGLDAPVTWQDVEGQATGATLLHRPRWSGAPRLRFRPWSTAEVQLDLRVLSRTLVRQIPVLGSSSVGGYQLLGLAGAWCFHDRLELRARLKNVADKD